MDKNTLSTYGWIIISIIILSILLVFATPFGETVVSEINKIPDKLAGSFGFGDGNDSSSGNSPPSHTHNFVQDIDEAYLDSPATCTKKAVYFYSCSCGAKGAEKFEHGEALGHRPGAEATCKTAQKCTVCQTTLMAINPDNHTGVEVESSRIDATCTINGTIYYKYNCCNASAKTESITAPGHTPGAAATCTTDQKCTVCQETLEGAKGHAYNNVVTAPTCTEDGYTTHTCSRCDDSYTDTEVEATGHAPGTAATCTTAQECTTCHTSLADINPENHVGTTKTEYEYLDNISHIVKTICNSCGEEISRTTENHNKNNEDICPDCDGDAHVHAYTEKETDETYLDTPATCTEKAVYFYSCSCGAKGFEKFEHGEALGHTPGAAATCTTAQKCTVCQATLEAAKSHNYESVVTAPTCTEEGYTTHTCSRCSDSYTDTEVDALGHTPGAEATCTTAQKCTVCQATLEAAKGHNYESVVTDPTCTEQGYTTHTCSKCGDSYVDTYIAAKGHTDDGTGNCTDCGGTVTDHVHNFTVQNTDGEYLDSDATCTAKATYVYSCACGAKGTEKFEHGEALGHTPGAEATCTAAQKCTVCQTILDEIDPDNHTGYIVESSRIDATCTSTGTVYYKYNCCNASAGSDTLSIVPGNHTGSVVESSRIDATCTINGTIYYKYNCCNASAGTESITAPGHTPGTAATCTTDQKCTVCHETLEGAKGHAYNNVVTAPTCTEKGYTTHTCSRCGDSYVDAYTNELGHWLIDQYRTENYTHHYIKCGRCQQWPDDEIHEVSDWSIEWISGNRYKLSGICTKCDGTAIHYHDDDGEPCPYCDIGYHNHDYKDVEEKAATCTTEGLVNHTCTICGYSYEETIPALGHAYSGVVTAPTCTENGYTTHTCSRCDDSYVDDYTSKLGHSLTEQYRSKNYTSHYIKCGRCQQWPEEEIHEVSNWSIEWISGTRYQISGLCTKCGGTAIHYHDDTGEPCPYCDIIHPHNYIVSEMVEATCTEAGYVTYVCAESKARSIMITGGCGHTYTEEIPALGHDYSLEVMSDEYLYTRATCVGGFAAWYKLCSTCEVPSTSAEDTFSNWVQDYKNHDLSAGTYYTYQYNPNNIAHHDEITMCANCDHEITRNEVACGTNGWVTWDESADSDGIHQTHCADCNGTPYGQSPCSFVHGRCEDCNGTHSGCSYMQKNTDEYYLAYSASCLSPAEYYYSCSTCGAKGTKTFTSGSEKHGSKVQIATDGHLKTAGTCTTAAVYYESCADCGYNFSTTFTVPAPGHMTVSYVNLSPDTFGTGTGVYVELTIENLSSSTVTIICRRNGVEYSNLTQVCTVSGGQAYCTINNAVQTGTYVIYAKCACGEEFMLGSFKYNSNGSYS